MTHSIAWSGLSIATRDSEDHALILRRFQFIHNDLGETVYEGAIGLKLNNGYSVKQYQRMALKSVLQYASMNEATVIINTEEDLETLSPYLQIIVSGFSEKLGGD
jgi:hypothetical protein